LEIKKTHENIQTNTAGKDLESICTNKC
jgi:hypothetical protein